MDTIQIRREMREAIKMGNLEHVRDLINKNDDLINMMTAFGTWLHVAATVGNFEIVKFLVETGADVNIKGGTFNGSALNLAASNGHLEIARYLLDHGASMDTSEPERNPLFAAVYGGHLTIAKFLIARGIDFQIRYTGESMKDMGALEFARERGQTEIATYLAKLLSSSN